MGGPGAAGLFGLMAGLAFFAGGCGAGGVSVTRIDSATVGESLLTASRAFEELSEPTRQTLRLLQLQDLLARNPTATFAALLNLDDPASARERLAARAEIALLAGSGTVEQTPAQAAGWYLAAAAQAYEYMFDRSLSTMTRALDPRFQRMREVYNRAVELYVMKAKEIAGGFHAHRQETLLGSFLVEIDQGSGGIDPTQLETILVARDLKVKGLRNRYRIDGLGGALVSVRENRQSAPLDRFRPPEGIIGPATAVLRFEAASHGDRGVERRATLLFYDPRSVTTVHFDSDEVALEADLTSPFAYLASLGDLPRVAKKGLRRPESYLDRQGLHLIGEYDPAKIPLLTIHGLRSSPVAWLELTNDLLGDPELRAGYQVWHYLYPTGLPFLYSAMVLRALLEELRVELDPEGDDPASQGIVVVAHSMGGLLAKTLISDSGREIWNTVFDVPRELVMGATQDVDWVEDILVFSPRPYVGRVIFIATPHRGVEAADSLLAQLGSSLVELPDYFTDRIQRVLAANPEVVKSEMMQVLSKGNPNSIRVLRPDHPLMLAFSRLSLDERIPYHTILGDRGKGPEERISDGWVTYQSAHLEGARSERVVASGHGAYSHPEAILEIKRILRQHLDSGGANGRPSLR